MAVNTEEEMVNKVLAMLGREPKEYMITSNGVAVVEYGELDVKRLINKALSL